MKVSILSIILAGILLLSVNSGQAESAQRNGFSIEDPLVPLEDILSGGPPRDGIPSIDSPKFVSAAEVDWLFSNSRVLGLEINGVVRAYPLAILNWHEIVNDTVGGVPLAITYCPLCGTGMAFRRDFKGTVTTLGVSGLLYNSDLLLYDRQSESLWSQVMGQAVSGPRKGEKLIPVPIEHTPGKTGKSSIRRQKFSPAKPVTVAIMPVRLMETMMKMATFISPCHSAAVSIIPKRE